MYDIVIIGAGPAGVAAGIYAVRREMKTLVISKDVGGQVGWAGEIENYPGFTSIKNYELVNLFEQHLKAAGVELALTEVKQVRKNEDGTFTVFTGKDELRTKSIIIAMGLVPRRLAISGEEQFAGKGVSYCANCDGPLFKNKTVAVIGGGNAALDAAEVLSKIASQVYLIHRSSEFRAFDGLVEEVKARPNITLLENSEVVSIEGGERLEQLKVKNRETGAETSLPVNGLFIEIGRIAHTDVFESLVERDERKQILVSEKCETSTPGIFAAGDVTNVEFKQITVAAGQGTIAALSAYQYLQRQSGKSANILDRSKK